MKYAKYLAVLGMLLIPASYAHAQRLSVGIGVGGPIYGPPVCSYGYYLVLPIRLRALWLLRAKLV